jgi:hypothetical protein
MCSLVSTSNRYSSMRNSPILSRCKVVQWISKTVYPPDTLAFFLRDPHGCLVRVSGL